MTSITRIASRAALALIGGALAAGFGQPAQAAGTLDIPVILPLTGGASFVGTGTWNGLKAFQDLINQKGGVNGKQLHFSVHDDQTSPQVAVQLTNDAMATHTPVILGSTITAMCNAQAPLVAASGPVVYCFSPGVHPPAGSYEFSATVSTLDLAHAMVRFFRLKGWTKIAIVTTTDASGQDAERGLNDIMALPENKTVSVVARAHFNPSDVSVAAQVEVLKAAQPQAVIAWTTGAPLATVLKAMVQAGLDVPTGTTNGNESVDQLTQYASFLPKQLFLPSGTFPAHDGLYKLDPKVEAAQHDMYAAYKAHNLPIDNHSASAWDPAQIVIDGLRKLGDGATGPSLRGYITSLTGYAGAYGLYDFKKTPQRGLGLEDAVMTRWSPQEKRFVWVSKPGGEPLDK